MTAMKKKSVSKVLCGAFLAFCTFVSANAEFKAGFARIDVTPPLGIPLVGYFRTRPADGVFDPLCAECVAVSDGESTALIYSVDNLQLRNEFFAAAFPAITAATGVPRDRIYVHSTHTHTGPAVIKFDEYTDEQVRLTELYAKMLVTRLADVGREAMADLAPSKLAVAKTTCPGISFIRRYRMKDGTVRTNPGVNNPNIDHPLGTPDDTLQVVRFMRTGAPDIAIVNFGTHPDTVGGTRISADWPGVVRRTFENGIGGGVKCLFLNAAQGDVNHVNTRRSPKRAAIDSFKNKNTVKALGTAMHMGRKVAGVAMGVWDECEEIPTGAVRGAVTPVAMKTNMPTADEIKWVDLFDAGRKDEIPLKGMELTTLTSRRSRVRMFRNGPDHLDILISSVAIGDSLAFAGVPCEPFVDIGRDIKAGSPFRATLVSCLVNGSEGYIPSTKAHHEGGYEGLSSRFKAETGDRMAAAQVEQLKRLAGKEPAAK